ncbi:hypothetical protein HK102_010312 [Quaeritorhiza haematococci]|nr:hypothetical protein HK102_010312 [Quaeritorhiza haematococci]
MAPAAVSASTFESTRFLLPKADFFATIEKSANDYFTKKANDGRCINGASFFQKCSPSALLAIGVLMQECIRNTMPTATGKYLDESHCKIAPTLTDILGSKNINEISKHIKPKTTKESRTRKSRKSGSAASLPVETEGIGYESVLEPGTPISTIRQTPRTPRSSRKGKAPIRTEEDMYDED